MTLMLQLPPGAEAVLRARAEAEGRPAEEVAGEMLANLLDPAADLTTADIAAMREGVRRGLADVAAGREMDFTEYAEQFETDRRRRAKLSQATQS